MSIARPIDRAQAAHRALGSLEVLIACLALMIGALAWMYFFNAGLVLSHYDAKAHLVVARRVIDNLTPGWQQFGAVWLPLPHALLLLPVQNDLLYRTGLAGSALSLACLAVTTYAASAFVRRTTGSAAGGAAAAALVLVNPNLLYLFTTPMTEPLLLAVTFLLVLWLGEWIDADSDRLPVKLGWLLAAAAWTRYEAWAVIAAAGAATLVILIRRGVPAAAIARRARAYAVWPVAAAVIFLINSRITVGRWFVAGGFFVPDQTYAGDPGRSIMAVVDGTLLSSGTVVAGVALLGVLGAIWRGSRARSSTALWVALALLAVAILPIAAFYEGHPFRIRYMTPLAAAAALWCGIAVGLLPRRAHALAAGALVATAVWQAPPLSARAPMILEAQLDRPAGFARRIVSECLAHSYRGDKVLASMGSLAHYMQELSWEGFALRDFVHEGNGVIWEAALDTGPSPHVGWMLVEEVAEGGDVLAERVRRDPSFLTGMTRDCSGGGVSLYRRESAPNAPR